MLLIIYLVFLLFVICNVIKHTFLSFFLLCSELNNRRLLLVLSTTTFHKKRKSLKTKIITTQAITMQTLIHFIQFMMMMWKFIVTLVSFIIFLIKKKSVFRHEYCVYFLIAIFFLFLYFCNRLFKYLQ